MLADICGVERAFEELRRPTRISCWHCAEYESYAMWKLYAAQRKGVAVVSSVARMKSALRPFRLAPHFGEEDPYWGRVRYVDLHAVRLEAGMVERFFYKHRALESEREFRVAISVRMAEELGVSVPDAGIDVPFVPADLVERIYLGPDLSSDDREAVLGECSMAGLESRVTPSTLLGMPRYT